MIEIQEDKEYKINADDFQGLFTVESLDKNHELIREEDSSFIDKINTCEEIIIMFPGWANKTCLLFKMNEKESWQRLDIKESVLKKYFNRRVA